MDTNSVGSSPSKIVFNDKFAQFKQSKVGRLIFSGFGVFVLLGGLAAGTVLVQNQQLFNKKAASGPPSTHCDSMNVYSESWVKLTDLQLTTLQPGSDIYFCAVGVVVGGSVFDAARFSVNGSAWGPDTKLTRPGSTNLYEFCEPYTVPAGITTFDIKAQMHELILGWI